MRLVMKFGGTSVGGDEQIENVCKIIEKYKDKNEIAVVVSALAGVTDYLAKLSKYAESGELKQEELQNAIAELGEKHRGIASNVAGGRALESVLFEIEKNIQELEKVLTGVTYVGELTPRSCAYILSFGERLSAPILAAALNTRKINATWLSGYEAGIVTDSNFERATPIWSKTAKNVKNKILPLLKASTIPVIAGFIAADEKKRITTLGRGGSDYTAAIIGAYIGADEVWIWTDVDGIMTTDPRLVKETKTIPIISYVEAMELAFFGAKVLHPKTIEPAMEKGVPVRVKNTFNPSHEGTLIVKEQETTSDVVKAISVSNSGALLTISGAGMIGVPGVAAKTFSALAKNSVNILMISQSSSEANISIVVEKADLGKAVEVIKEEFKDTGIIKEIKAKEDIAIIAVVGAGMKGTKGVAARVFTAVANAEVNVFMIAQGSSEVNISFVVDAASAKNAVQALHEEFISKKK